jgi:hypothetical protein
VITGACGERPADPVGRGRNRASGDGIIPMTENTITHQVQAAKETLEKLFRGGDIRDPAEGRGYQGPFDRVGQTLRGVFKR